MDILQTRLAAVDWTTAEISLDDCGFATLPGLLPPEQCQSLIDLYAEPTHFRTRIDMARYRFGKGEYQYFRYPLPQLVEQLRQGLYSRLAPVANRWAQQLKTGFEYPRNLEDLLATCHARDQPCPTPLLLRYGPGDHNCLHQDLYGEIAFPFQAVVFLSDPDTEYSGGEFLLADQIPRAQTRVRAFRPRQGEALIITTRHRPGISKRPGTGKQGHYRISMRHGVSDVTAGNRWTLGVIFHDAT